MSVAQTSSASAPLPVYRLSQFAVPTQAMPAFMAQAQRAQALLRAMPGCNQSLLLSQTVNPNQVNVVSLVEWASQEAMAAAKSEMEAHQAKEGFDPEAFRVDLGIQASSAIYSAVHER